MNYDDDILNSVFDQGENQLLLVDAGTSIYRFFDVGIGFGRSKSQGFLLSADGSVSSEVDELRVLPNVCKMLRHVLTYGKSNLSYLLGLWYGLLVVEGDLGW